MITRQFFRALVLLYIGLVLAACVSTPNATNNTSALLWKVEKPGVPSSYLFGTIHSEDPRVLALPTPVKQAFTKAKSLVLEIDFAKDSNYAMQAMFFRDGRQLKSLLSEATYAQTLVLMRKRGLQEKQVNLMKPWSLFTLMNMPEPESGVFLDMSLFQHAMANGKTIIGLETIQEQIATFDGLAIETQIDLLEYSLAHIDEFSSAMEDTIKLYLSRDLEQLSSMNDSFMQKMPRSLATTFKRRLITERNLRMHQRVLAPINAGSAFVAVGALHLPGETGLIESLKNSGFLLTPIY